MHRCPCAGYLGPIPASETRLHVSPRDVGLTQSQVLAARKQSGWNELPAAESAGPFRVLLRQFSSFLVMILVVAAGVAFLLGEWIDTATIGMVVFLNAVLGFVQEWKAETALKSLRKLLSPQAMVIRDGMEQSIPAKEIVPGDILVLAPGAKVAADATLIRLSDLAVDESILTGESMPVNKSMENGDTGVFAGTSITSGRAEAQVTATGQNTEFGRIAHLTGSIGTKTTNLQHKLGQLARQLGVAALLVAAGVTLLGIVLGREPVEMVMTGLSLSVAMVPEGLPAVVTITLALGATAMVRQNALARRLQAVETLGAASVICTDKTGTLTENKMTATRVWTLDRAYEVTGTGYDPAGHIEAEGQRLRAQDDDVLAALLHTGLYCNHARLDRDGTTWTMIGEPTEGALVTLAYKGWCDLPNQRSLLAELPFSSDRKRMSVLYQSPQDAAILTKGAPEQILDMSTDVLTQTGQRALTDADRTAITEAYQSMASKGLRVIAIARRSAPDQRIVEEDLTFLGLVGLIDPPRTEVRAAITSAQSAGIRVIMITGDSPLTATAIANQLGLKTKGHVTGTELDDLGETDLGEKLKGDILFARTKPEQKMRIVSALQAENQIVAMTGDGVNDAPALKQADIGVSMGIRGTDVARDASDLVLLDDNFATIVRAIAEGRRQFANVQKFVRYLLSSNAGEVVALVVNIAIGGPLVFLATQILWMNLVTDGVTAVALGLEKSEPDQMRHSPRRKETPILGLSGIITIALLGLYTGLSSLWIFFHLLDFGVDLARTTAFTAMVVFEKMSVFAFRSLRLTSFRIGWFSNPFLLAALAITLAAQAAAVYWAPLQTMLRTVPIGLEEWQLIALFAVPIIVVPEVLKAIIPDTQRATK
ncbi:MAG: cation-transporting P-type ATPase [Silicimonas sp.]|nr:cation-transporting P-type ATPase [Silicimonas sp.]